MAATLPGVQEQHKSIIGRELEMDTKGIPMMQGKIMANAPHEPQPNFPSIPR